MNVLNLMKKEQKPVSMQMGYLYNAEKKRQKLTYKVFPWLLPVIIIICMAGDFMTIFPLIDSMLYQSAGQVFMVTAVAILLLDGIPYIAGGFYMKEEKTASDKIWFVVLMTVFFVTVIALFYLRWNTQELQYDTTETKLTVSTFEETGDTEEEVFKPTAGQKAMTLFLGFLPVGTSMITFAASCMYSISKTKREYNKSLRIKLLDMENDLGVQEEEIRKELEWDMQKYDEGMFLLNLDDIKQLEVIAKLKVREKLAEKLGTPDSVSKLLEGEEEMQFHSAGNEISMSKTA